MLEMFISKHEKQKSEEAISMLLLNLSLKCFFLQNLEQSKTKSLFQCEDLGLANRAIVKDSETNILGHEFRECHCNNSDFQWYLSFSVLQPKVNCTWSAFQAVPGNSLSCNAIYLKDKKIK